MLALLESTLPNRQSIAPKAFGSPGREPLNVSRPPSFFEAA
jgi:hypothetical protein